MDLRGLIVLFMVVLVLSAHEDDDEDDLIAEEEECHSTELTHIPLKVSKKPSSWSSTPLDVYHFDGFETRLSLLFMEVHLQINLTDEQSYQIYQGNNCSSMMERYRDDQRLFGLLRYASILRSKHLSPFGRSLIGVCTNEAYNVRVRVWNVNYIRLGVFLGAVALFVMSRSLVRNALLYYASGCFTGYVASLLIVAIILYRFTPKRWAGIPILFGGWSLSFYLVYSMWKNLTMILLQYQKLVAAYVATVTLISLAVCYRYGPPTDVRSHNLAQWALQTIALVLIYFSCQIVEVAYSVIAILLVLAATKRWLIGASVRLFDIVSGVWSVLFPKSRRLLTMEEYESQGEVETAKALEQLRAYCRSPDADVWRITSSLRSPRRFARFVDGSRSHVSDEESVLHDLECSRLAELSDDSGEDEVVVQRSATRLQPQRDHAGSAHRSELRYRGNTTAEGDADSFDSTSDSEEHQRSDSSRGMRTTHRHKPKLSRSRLSDYQRTNGTVMSADLGSGSSTVMQRSSRGRLFTDDSESRSSASDGDE